MTLRWVGAWVSWGKSELKHLVMSAVPLLMCTLLIAIGSTTWLLCSAWQKAPPPPPWEPLFIERFDDPKALEHVSVSPPDQGHEATQDAWQVREGRLWGKGGHNAALWFEQLTLPEQARIEFKARAETDTGDIKCELYGDGQTHQSGLIIINGGWHNKLRVIARRDEHGEDQKSDRRCAPNCAPKGQEQQWVVERRRGVVSWYLNDRLAMRWVEGEPLLGNRFAFNHWEAEVSYDDLRVYDLSSPN